MATAANIPIKPDHVIIHLDRHMGERPNNRPFKKDLANNASLECPSSNECALDIDNLINSVEQNMKNENLNDSIKNPVRIFTDEVECIKCINDNIAANKRIFLVTSGEMGQIIIDKVYHKLSRFIYIFCGQMQWHIDNWAYKYKDNIDMFDDDKVFLVRLLRDIGKYYKEKSEEPSLNPTSAITYLKWVRQLCLRANRYENHGGFTQLKEINDRVALIEASQSNNNDDEDKLGTDADEG